MRGWRKTPGGKASRLKDKQRPSWRAYLRRKVSRRYYKNRAFLESHKNKPCHDCGMNYLPCVMDFHHIVGTKSNSVSHIAISGSRDRILREIKKCVLLSSNCHRIRHHHSSSLRREAVREAIGVPV